MPDTLSLQGHHNGTYAVRPVLSALSLLNCDVLCVFSLHLHDVLYGRE